MLTMFFKILILVILVDLLIVILGHFWKMIKKTFGK